jgi:hypothetical protein
MPGETPSLVKPNGTSVLSSLASSGDNWVKLMIVFGMILNVYMTNKTSNGVDQNSRELVKARNEIFREVRVIYKNQKKWTAYLREDRMARDQIFEKLGLPPMKQVPIEEPDKPDPEGAMNDDEENNAP